jgi:hypothetical protein
MTYGEVIIKNSTDENGRLIKKVWAKKITKLGREKWDMVWQFYRDRKTVPVTDVIKKYKPEDLHIDYSSKVFEKEKPVEQLQEEQSTEPTTN